MSEVALSIVLGIGLAAATGFRVFLPMLIVSAAAYSGHLPLGDSFAWLGTAPALLTQLEQFGGNFYNFRISDASQIKGLECAQA